MHPKITQNHFLKAFSLIEMMFVIVIIAAISLYAVNLVRNRAADAAVTSTADTMVQWLQASQNYYGQHAYWPQGWNDLYDPDNNIDYLPNAAGCSKILQSTNNYACPYANQTYASCGQYGPICTSYATNMLYNNSPYIVISTPVPDAATGQKIANLIPNGSYDADSGLVYARAVIPGTMTGGANIYTQFRCNGAYIVESAEAIQSMNNFYHLDNLDDNIVSVTLTNTSITQGLSYNSGCNCTTPNKSSNASTGYTCDNTTSNTPLQPS